MIFTVAFFWLLGADASANSLSDPGAAAPNPKITDTLSHLFHDRTQSLLDGESKRIEKYYIAGNDLSRKSLLQELKRSQYVNSWADKRNLKFTQASGDIFIKKCIIEGNQARIFLDNSTKLSYIYLDRLLPPQSFGIGTRHSILMQKRNNEWKILKEWYLDPLSENPKLIPQTPNGSAPSVKSLELAPLPKEKYNRSRAVSYANKYAGAAWGAGNGRRYNSKYKDYTGSGGDCTNFVSQVLGDPTEGGGLSMNRQWNYRSWGGSNAWIHTDLFKNQLLHSGHGTLIAKGLFPDIVRSIETDRRLYPGDLIGYVLKGNVDHFSVVTGFDSNGYPLVNSHTADRYRVPFDLGWDKNTEYLVIHVQ